MGDLDGDHETEESIQESGTKQKTLNEGPERAQNDVYKTGFLPFIEKGLGGDCA